MKKIKKKLFLKLKYFFYIVGCLKEFLITLKSLQGPGVAFTEGARRARVVWVGGLVDWLVGKFGLELAELGNIQASCVRGR